MDEPAEKINVKVNSPKAQPVVDASAVASEPLDSAMTEAINAIDISSDGKLTQAPQAPAPQPAPAEPAPSQPTAEPEPPVVAPAADEPSAAAEPTSDNVPKFGALQAVIDEHPLFSGAKEPIPKRPRKMLMKKVLAPIVALVAVIVIGYLLIDSGVVRGASHLPFHVFKQPVAAITPTISPAQSAAPAVTAKPISYQPTIGKLSDGPGADWQTYTNTQAGFSIQIPKLIESDYGSSCTKDRGGSYRPTTGTVPATVVEGSDTYYITEAYTYQLGGQKEVNGIANFASCTMTTASPELLKQNYASAAPSTIWTYIPLKIVATNDQAGLLADVQQIFSNDKDVTIASQKANSGGWQDITPGCSNPSTCQKSFNYKFYLRYFPDKKKLVYIELGQSVKLQGPSPSSTIYDTQVADSFKLL